MAILHSEHEKGCPTWNISAIDWNRDRALQMLQTWKRILHLTTPTLYAKGARIFREGDFDRHVLLVADGWVLLTCDLPTGDVGVLGLRFIGQFLDHCSCSNGRPHAFSAYSVNGCAVYRVEENSFRTSVFHDPEGSALLQEAVQIDLYNAAVSIMQLKVLSPEERLRKFLKFVASVLGVTSKRESLRIPFALRDDQLAALLGLSCRQFKRIKKHMHDTGQLSWQDHSYILNDAR